jgi:hypothetical protein
MDYNRPDSRSVPSEFTRFQNNFHPTKQRRIRNSSTNWRDSDFLLSCPLEVIQSWISSINMIWSFHFFFFAFFSADNQYDMISSSYNSISAALNHSSSFFASIRNKKDYKTYQMAPKFLRDEHQSPFLSKEWAKTASQMRYWPSAKLTTYVESSGDT